MNAIPQAAELSTEAKFMQEVFSVLESPVKWVIGQEQVQWDDVAAFVLAALDAFADEQQPAEAADKWRIGTDGLSSPKWWDEVKEVKF